MSMTAKYSKNVNKSMDKVRLFGLILGITAVLYGVFSYVNWVSTTSPEVSSTADVRGATVCETIENIDLWKGIAQNKAWFLLGDEFSSEQSLEVIATLDPNATDLTDLSVYYEIEGTNLTGELVRENKNAPFTGTLDTSALKPGTYTLSVYAQNDCSTNVSTQTINFNVSYPVYVVWSIDWEGSDVKQQYLEDMNDIANTYDVPMTHFFNPRIYVPGVTSASRAQYLTSYVLNGAESRGDAVGLHLHMFPDMVSAAGVTPQYTPAWGSSRTDGYDIVVSGYSYDDMNRVIEWSTNQFAKNGLETPVMFRAGGWFADEGTLRVLENNDFVLDSSGRTAYTLGTNNLTTHWDLAQTAQPYHPSYADQNKIGDPGMDLWEFPNNGGDSWAFSKDEMLARYRANYSGGASNNMTVITFLSHPDWFNVDKPKMESLFGQISADLYTSDSGPVVYTTLADLYPLFEK